jgi:DNA-binding MarR family transcriptional regulator
MPISDALLDNTDLAARLRLAVTRLARRLRQQAEGEATPSQVSALASVDRIGPITLGQLAAVERVTPPSMTRIVSGLEQAGFVSRQVDPKDRRIARVETTVAGQRFLERTRSRKNAYLAARVRTLDPEDRAVLARAATILERLLEGEQ